MQAAQLRFAQDIVEEDGDFCEWGAWLFIFLLEGLLARRPASFFHSGLQIACIQPARVQIVDPHVTLGPFPEDDWDAGRN